MGPPPWVFLRGRGLREMVLWALSEKPQNGAEIIRFVEDSTWGFWRPSPGSIYPLLRQMEGDGLVKKRADGRYELTEVGRSALKTIPWLKTPFRWGQPRTVDEIIEEVDSWALYLADLATSEPEKVKPYIEKIRRIIETLQKIEKTPQ